MSEFINDVIHLTEGELFIKYLWLWLIILVIAFFYLGYSEKRGD